MKKILGFLKENEQWLLFVLIIAYLNVFFYIFEYNMRTDWRYPTMWLVQFFGLATLFGIRMRKKGWKLPKNIKDTHSW